eukprot:TRINITY_DN3465_c0_g7_i1.p1 TRINITY_DN3465_c0_g7~~TRINITY_DN3465_c0_g7_i1.p1  ORF type:complete len:960 (+),score=147.35 TRINITY_DN3465_c0_g7_i1:40-2919(+)
MANIKLTPVACVEPAPNLPGLVDSDTNDGETEVSHLASLNARLISREVQLQGSTKLQLLEQVRLLQETLGELDCQKNEESACKIKAPDKVCDRMAPSKSPDVPTHAEIERVETAHTADAEFQEGKTRLMKSLHSFDANDENASVTSYGETQVNGVVASILNSKAFSALSNVALFFALFGKSFWVICDFPDVPALTILDTLLLICMIVFGLDVVLKVLVQKGAYMKGQFFALDILGTVSIAFDISYMLGFLGQMDSGMDASVARSARAAKVGARAGRMLKLMRLLSLVLSGKKEQKVNANNIVEAKVLTKRLTNVLSTKVSMLTIVLVLGTPMFGITLYPSQDLSMQAWTLSLKSAYGHAVTELELQPSKNETDAFQASVQEFSLFYASLDYAPFKLQGFCEEGNVTGRRVRIPGQSFISASLAGKEPARSGNVFPVQVILPSKPSDCEEEAFVFYDFTGPNQMEAIMDVFVIVFIVAVMAGASYGLNKIINAMLVKPFEFMLVHVAHIVGHFNINVEGIMETELDLLYCVLEKFTRVIQLSAQSKAVSDEYLEDLDYDSKAILLEVLELVPEDKHKQHRRKSLQCGDATSGDPWTDIAEVEAWTLDVLKYDEAELNKLVVHIFWDSRLREVGARAWTDPDTFHRFQHAVRESYNDLPYHCFAHAIDVLHFVYRLQCLTSCEKWMSSVEQYGLLIAAFAHDLGHFGKTNPFLVETRQVMALRYNDKSPLENMHCATLFEICSNDSNNIFSGVDKTNFSIARKVCINAILHTDNAHHFDTVKEISKIFEECQDICKTQAKSGTGSFTPQYHEEVLKKHKMEWIQVFLHMADISNPLKPYGMCAAWAVRVLDEFFAQGDEEKSLGLPVGMLNDREKVNRPGSQHGFINFLVAPFVIATVNLFPVLHPLTTQMASNLKQWRNAWVEDAKPSEDDIRKRDADVQKIQDTACNLSKQKSFVSITS